MRRVMSPVFLLLAACLPVPEPEAGAPPDLATPRAPTALASPVVSEAAVETAPEGLLAVPLDSPSAGESLGRVIVSPGNAAEPGLWLRTSRAVRTAQGTVVAGNGVAANVLLIPADGVSLLSAEGYAALGLPPGTFAEVTIYLR